MSEPCAPGRRCTRGAVATFAIALAVIVGQSPLVAQVSEGDVEIVNVRETDPTLGPLVATLVGLGLAALLATVVFWFWTRPKRRAVSIERPHDQTRRAPHDG